MTPKQHYKNVFLRMSVAKYIANDFKHIYGKESPKITAEYIAWLEQNITMRPLMYIPTITLRHVNELLSEENIVIYFDPDTQTLKLKHT